MALCHCRVLMLAGAALVTVGAGVAVAGPNGGNVVGGNATIQGQGTGSVTINQSSQRAVINWNTFDIGVGETTRFVQPNSASVALNRVVGGLGPTQLLGTLMANGQVFIVNGDGILVGPNAVINTSGFLATTSDIRNADFMAGKYNFNIPGLPSASIVNLGTITATSGGFAALVAPGVRNSGTITATLGTVALAAGNAFTLDFYGDKLITLAVTDQIAAGVIDVATGKPLKSLVGNDGKLSANGGRVELTAAAARAVVDSVVNNTGVIEADSIGTRNGMIVLGAATAASKPAGAPQQIVKLSGKLSAAGRDKGARGGTVVVTGESIALAGATIDASGAAGGGKVLIGGDTGGGKVNPAAASIELAKLEAFVIPTATKVTVDAASTINASATGNGNAGKVVLWSEQQTTFAGTILARGGPAGGNGGFVETSSHGQLNFQGIADLRAPLGKVGTLLLDPADYYIVTTLGGSPAGASELTNAALQAQLALGDVTITTSTATNPTGQNGDVFVNASVNWSSNNALTLSASNNININSGITLTNGTLNLNAGNAITINSTVGISGAGAVNMTAATDATFGNVLLSFGSGGSVQFTGAANSGQALAINGQPYTLLYSMSDVQGINATESLSGFYALAKPLDASGVSNWTPIGTDGASTVLNEGNGFNGLFQGLGNTIDKLTINSAAQYVGLFGYIGSGGAVSNLGVTNANIVSSYNGTDTAHIGSIAGLSNGTIDRSYFSGSVSAAINSVGVADVGGLVGTNGGSITNSFAIGTVGVNVASIGTLDELILNVGGLVGSNGGRIIGSYATGAVGVSMTGAADAYVDVDTSVGGLVGTSSRGSITDSYATGAVNISGANVLVDIAAGGLVGTNYGAISNSYASGAVSMTVTGASASDDSGASAGGLVGYNNGPIRYAYATGAVTVSMTGADQQNISGAVGGLIGYNNGRVTQTYATGAVSATGESVGGLVGFDKSDGGILESYWDTQTTGQQTSAAGTGLTTAQFMDRTKFKGWQFGSSPGNCGQEGGACWVIVSGDGSLNNSGGGATRPFLLSEYSTTISNSHQLQLAALQPNASYTLANNISLGTDLQNPSSMWGPAGFVPIGNISFGGFTGTFDGQNHVIDGLAMAPTDPHVNNIGLFGTIYGSVSNLILTNASISANPNVGLPGQFVGVLAGQNGGTVSNVFAIGGTVNGLPSLAGGVIAGGLVGQNGVFISNNTVAGTDSVGPSPQTFVTGTIVQSSASVDVTVGDGVNCFNNSCLGGLNLAGGLVGSNNGTINAFSFATGNVVAGLNSFAGGLAGANNGAISYSYATGDVSVTGGTNTITSFAGGLVGQNGNGGSPAPNATIDNSFAIGNVTGTGPNLAIGGLVGNNAAGSTITDSQARGNVTLSTDATAQSQLGGFTSAGGLVGFNQGTVRGTTAPPTSAPVGEVTLVSLLASSYSFGCLPGSAYSCASGNVQVGARGQAGGLVGNNDGTLTNVIALGAVTGAAGLPPDINQGNDSNKTQLGGLVGLNTGSIGSAGNVTSAVALGPVGTAGIAYLEVGGLVGQNRGVIGNAVAKGAVTTGDNGVAGGLTGNNSPSTFVDTCPGGCKAVVFSSQAYANVVVGAASFAGGLSGSADGSFSNTTATGSVTGGANSVLGGLVGGMGALIGPSFIYQSKANVVVTSTGPNSTVGGLVGVNGGKIDQSHADGGAVIGTSQSFLGGIAGVNVGSIDNSSASVQVTGTGSQNFVGGVAGLNFGLIDPTTSSGNVSSGGNSVVGGLVGGNGAFNNFLAGQLLGSTFPVGTISSDSVATGSASGGAGSTVGPQIGENYPIAGLPSYPSLINSCNNAVCTVLANGQLFDPNATPSLPITPSPGPSPAPPPGPSPAPPLPPSPATEAQLIQNLVQNITLASTTLGEVVSTVSLTQPPPRTGPGPGPAPGGLPPQFGARFFVPPPLGTSYKNDEVVLQIPNNIPLARLQSVLASLGLSILGSQNMSLIGVTSYQVHIDNGTSIASVIQALAGFQIVAGAQANYTYQLMQELAQDPDLAGLTQGEGDAAQYAIGKLGLIDVHRRLKGSNISVAVIDSQIDVKHPDLDGVIVEQFDAVGGEAEKPHPHGTGMAGAIGSHRRLMGIAPSAQLYAIHAFSSGAASAESTTFNILKALEWASGKGVRVINMSFAGPRDPSMERALKAAHDKGIVLIAAAGNAGPKSPPLYPGADPNVIAVTATDVNDKLFTGANRGRYIAVAAPGVDILVPAPDNTYQLTTGTSVASAEVSGLAALLLERNPSLGPEDIRKILTSSAHRLSSKDRDDDFGSGLIDPGKAIQTAGDLKPSDLTGAAPPRPASAPPVRPAASTLPPALSSSRPVGTGPRPMR